MKIKDGFLLKKIAGSYHVIAINSQTKKFNKIIHLNDTGAFLWKLLQDNCNEKFLVESLNKEYEVDYATAEKDVNKFISELKEAELVD